MLEAVLFVKNDHISSCCRFSLVVDRAEFSFSTQYFRIQHTSLPGSDDLSRKLLSSSASSSLEHFSSARSSHSLSESVFLFSLSLFRLVSSFHLFFLLFSELRDLCRFSIPIRHIRLNSIMPRSMSVKWKNLHFSSLAGPFSNILCRCGKCS